MKARDIVDYMNGLFETKELDSFSNEASLTYDVNKEVKCIGYATNITLDVVDKAHQSGVDFLITHHDAWGFIYGLKEAVMDRLKEYDISHYFVHLPLDDAPFGTNSSLLKGLGLKEISKHCCYDGYCCGAIGEYEEGLGFEEFTKKFEGLLEEPALSWNFGKEKVKRVYVLCGAGGETDLMKEARELDVDVYITGEKNLYTVQYADLHKMNLIVGSHTFTEIFGVRNLMNLVKEAFPSISFVQIRENHLETRPMGTVK